MYALRWNIQIYIHTLPKVFYYFIKYVISKQDRVSKDAALVDPHLVKIAGSRWMRAAQDRSFWTLGGGYVESGRILAKIMIVKDILGVI